ncbi:RluA family pseudouridine synthase [Entomospira nematocerorum]|uniref:Pseudouridine synthase n=1 Tax=Entomospira nematocerorum TaxID=2719987 RepID=A0A968GE31_9SPIO|nr:RluA family pseudouridine synthase [Entomospira nematocera]NIZ47574.1 RluA family pseudouridine synthase [Entomospira nematocera]WDI33887.1 RluA family pseudouridine synthase [Entomospira nematocera]
MQQFNDIITCSYPRLDRYISEYLGLIPRSQLKTSRIKTIQVDGKPVKLGQKILKGQHLLIEWEVANAPHLIPQNIPLSIIYEDEYVWVINKPQGMVVHPGSGRPDQTLANALAYRLKENDSELYDTERPGIVHRLDMDTSGVIICAKDATTHKFLAEQFQNRTVKKRYLAILDTPHITPPRGLIKNYIDRSRRVRTHFVCGEDPSRGRLAATGYRLLHNTELYSLVLFKPYTGRTHQLRVHAKNLLAPIVGDPIYNTNHKQSTLMLHAWKLQIVLPGQSEPSIFMAPAPDRFYQCLNIKKT